MGTQGGASAALDGLLVIDLTSDVAGAYAGKLLADLGARVVLVEPPGGSPLRARPPLPESGPHGALFAHLAGGKESVQPPADAAADILTGLLHRADILLLDGTSPFDVLLPAVRPERLVEVDFSPFGRSGP